MNNVTRAATWEDLKVLVTKELDGVSIQVLDLTGLLLTKEGMRDRDRADATVLRRACEELKRSGEEG